MSEKISGQEKFDKPSGLERAPATENEEAKKQLQHSRTKLHDAFATLFSSAMGGTYAQRNEDGFSGDAASIFVLVSLENEKGEKSSELIKVGWGEFSTQTFAGDKYPAFKNFPFDIYCVSQSDSYFADEKLLREMTENPQKYLSEHSLFAANSGQVQKSEKIDHRHRQLNREIQATPYDEMLCAVRNQIIRERTTPEEFAAFLRELPDDPVELGKHMRAIERSVEWLNYQELQLANEKTKAQLEKKRIMHHLWGMGVTKTGIAVGNEQAMESVLALKKQFDFETNSFTK